MKTAIIVVVLCAAVALGQVAPSPPKTCPTDVDAARCAAFHACMRTFPKPTPPVQGQQPTAEQKAAKEAIQSGCFTTAGLTAAEQTSMRNSKPKPPGPRPLPAAGQTTQG
uniref:Uncharacterized protein n=1 Tax=Plectus sambesii TaxID=2011161 RepID=A0A914WCC9_9BILA